MKTNWHIKKNNCSRHINFLSDCSNSQKVAMIYGLVDQSVKLATPEFRKQHLIKVTEICNENRPKYFCYKIIAKRIHQICSYKTKSNSKFTSYFLRLIF